MGLEQGAPATLERACLQIGLEERGCKGDENGVYEAEKREDGGSMTGSKGEGFVGDGG